jgi:F-type H+-transporting ATPase subunit c
MESLAVGITYTFAGGLAALAVGMIGAAALRAAGRNPEAANELRTMMILAISFADALAIIGFVAALIIKFIK